MKKFTSVALTALLLCAIAPSAFAARKATAKVINQSKWDIHHLFLSSVDEDSWGPDQLGEHVLESGGSFTLRGIPCDEYDVRIVDEDGDECVIEEIELCADRSVWKITNQDLLECEGYR